VPWPARVESPFATTRRRELPSSSGRLDSTRRAPRLKSDRGYSRFLFHCYSRAKGEEAALPHIIQSMAGPIAESGVNPRIGEFDGHTEDVDGARRIAAFSICTLTRREDGNLEATSEELERNADRLQALWKRGVDAAAQLVDAHHPAIKRVAALLLERTSLTGDEVAAIVNAGA
jgi:hypothetical protein